MYYDTLTTSAVCDELAGILSGGRVQRVVQATELAVGLEVYAGRRFPLYLSAANDVAGVWLAEAKVRRGAETPSPFHLLLNKYVRGARLESITQPAYERVLRFAFEGPLAGVSLICEIMGRYSNLILVDASDTILDAAKRVPASRNRYRTILPHQAYVPPPPQNKAPPLLLTPSLLQHAFEAQPDEPFWRRLVDAAAGISPLLAREVLYRALGETEPTRPLTPADYTAIINALDPLARLPQTHAWSPCVAYETDDTGRYAADFAPYPLTQRTDVEPVAGISQAIALVVAAQHAPDAYLPVRQRLNALIDAEVTRQETRLAALHRAWVPPAEVEALMVQGNAILALAWKISRGQRELLVDPAEVGLEESALPPDKRRIVLDPALSPSENAQALFREYRKAQAAAEQVPGLIAQGEAELAYLSQLRTDAALAENRSQLDQVQVALEAAGYVPAPKKNKPAPQAGQPLRLHAADGTLILVGRNSRENEEVTFRRAAPDDLWLHAHAVPGAHVIVKSGGGTLAEETLLLAARLAAYYSAARGEPQAAVDYTARRYVRPIKGGRPGMVSYTHECSLTATAEIDDVQIDEG